MSYEITFDFRNSYGKIEQFPDYYHTLAFIPPKIYRPGWKPL